MAAVFSHMISLLKSADAIFGCILAFRRLNENVDAIEMDGEVLAPSNY